MTVGEPLRFEDPRELGAYRPLRRLGHGGMGVVYLAEDAANKRVAVKVIHPHLAQHEEFRERFRSEVALARKVARFSTAPILDADTDADPPYIVTEFIDGPTLSQVVAEQGPLSGSQLHALGVGVAGALTAIHSAGVVHRDLKPGNVLLSRFGPRVIDFGIARAADAVTGVTRTGQYVGSPSFMAPEQFRGDAVNAATDIFAWGAVMAFAGTGRQPFGKTAEAVMYKVVYGEADLDGLDRQLAELVTRTLSKEPADRPTAPELLDLLVQGERPPAELFQPTAPSSGPPATTVTAPAPWQPPAPWPASPRPVPQPAPRPVWAAPPPEPGPPPYRGGRPVSGSPLPVGVGAPAPPRRSRRWVVWLLLSIFLVCCVGGGGTLGGLAYFGHNLDKDDSISALESYLDDVLRERHSTAYDQLCQESKIGLSREQYLTQAKDTPKLTSFDVDENSANYDLDRQGFTIAAQLRYAGGSSRTENYFVLSDSSDSDKYWICLPGDV